VTAACLSMQCKVLPSLHFECYCCLQQSYAVLRTSASAYAAGYQIFTSQAIEECCLHCIFVWSNSPLNENSSLPQNFPTTFAILLLLVLVPNPSLLFHSLCVFFSCGFLCLFFLHVKKFAVADVGLHLFSVKRFLYSLITTVVLRTYGEFHGLRRRIMCVGTVACASYHSRFCGHVIFTVSSQQQETAFLVLFTYFIATKKED